MDPSTPNPNFYFFIKFNKSFEDFLPKTFLIIYAVLYADIPIFFTIFESVIADFKNFLLVSLNAKERKFFAVIILHSSSAKIYYS